MKTWYLIIYLVVFLGGTAFFLWNINKRKEEVGSLRFTIKRTLNKTTIVVCASVLISWIVLMVLMFQGKVSIVKGDDDDFFMFILVGLATATVFSTIIAQFMCKTGFYNMGIIAAGNVVKYSEVSEVSLTKKKFMNKDELYDLVVLDKKKKNRGTMLCDEEERIKIKDWLKYRNIRLEEDNDNK